MWICTNRCRCVLNVLISLSSGFIDFIVVPTFSVLTDMMEHIIKPLIDEASHSGSAGFRRSRSAAALSLRTHLETKSLDMVSLLLSGRTEQMDVGKCLLIWVHFNHPVRWNKNEKSIRFLPFTSHTCVSNGSLNDGIKPQQLPCNKRISNGREQQMSLPWVIHLCAWKCLHLSSGRATHLEIDILEMLNSLSLIKRGPQCWISIRNGLSRYKAKWFCLYWLTYWIGWVLFLQPRTNSGICKALKPCSCVN